MSRLIDEAPITWPLASRIGDTVTAMITRRPSRAEALAFSQFDWLAIRHTAEQFVLRIMELRRDEREDGLADDLDRPRAEDALGRGVPS